MHTLGIDIGGGSVKAAAVRDGIVLWAGRSATYARPDAARLARSIAEAAASLDAPVERVGLCVPGILDDARERVVRSVNVPALESVPLADLLSRGVSRPIERPPLVVSDTWAAAHDLYVGRRLSGRLLALVLGTGVGAAVLDDGATPLRVDGDSPGHFGQLDVAVEGQPPVVGPDDGLGSLEGYIGAPALHERYGEEGIARATPDGAPVHALAHAVRIAHAIYRPQHVILAGGVGLRMGHLVAALRERVERGLTNIAREGWTLTVADSDFHAAVGAARLAAVQG